MTIERTDGRTPKGGDYRIAVYVRLDSMAECDKRVADGLIISEYLADGTFLAESVMALTGSKQHDAAPPEEPETPEEHFKRLGIEMEEETGDSIVTFVGPRGAAYARKLTGK